MYFFERSVYYCHPYCSCERGSNERLNREIRRLLPKGTDFSKINDNKIKAVAEWVNAYPREIFGYATSAELFNTHLHINGNTFKDFTETLSEVLFKFINEVHNSSGFMVGHSHNNFIAS